MNKSNFKSTILGALILGVSVVGCGNSDSFVFTTNNQTSTPVPAHPIAVNDAINALGNATLNRTAANGVLTNDTLNGASISSFDAVGSNSGTLVLNADGSLSYTPVVGFVGSETFTYTLSNADGSSTATITFTSTGLGQFVDNTAPAGGDGSQASPFNTLAAAVLAAGSGDTVFVARGNGTNTGQAGAINLPNGVNLIGEGTGLILGQTIVPAGLAPVIQGPVNCAGNNTVSGLTIEGSGSEGIRVENAGDVTISNNTIGNPTAQHILLLNFTGTVVIDKNTLQDPPDADQDCIRNENSVSADLVVTDNIFTNASNRETEALVAVFTSGTAIQNLTITGNVADGTGPDQFDFGIFVLPYEFGQANVTVSDNTLKNFRRTPINLFPDSDTSELGGVVMGNTVSNVSTEPGIYVDTKDDTITVSGNMVSNVEKAGIDVAANSGTFVVENNQVGTVSGLGAAGVAVGAVAGGPCFVAFRNNVLSAPSTGIVVAWDAPGVLCAEITGNTAPNGIAFENSGGGVLNVEQLGALSALNNGAPILNSNEATEVLDGACMIP